MARRSEHSQEQIREMVLQAAETIVDEEGFPALKVRKIAMEIGYTVGSIYMVFDNMADLIMHVKGRTLDELADELAEVEGGEDPQACIVALAKTYVMFAEQHYNRWSMIFEQCQQEQKDVPQWYREKANAMFSRIEQLFGQLQPELSEEQARLGARTLWSGVHGVTMLSLTGKLDLLKVDNIEAVVTLLVDSFFKGWLNTSIGGEND